MKNLKHTEKLEDIFLHLDSTIVNILLFDFIHICVCLRHLKERCRHHDTSTLNTSA